MKSAAKDAEKHAVDERAEFANRKNAEIESFVRNLREEMSTQQQNYDVQITKLKSTIHEAEEQLELGRPVSRLKEKVSSQKDNHDREIESLKSAAEEAEKRATDERAGLRHENGQMRLFSIFLIIILSYLF